MAYRSAQRGLGHRLGAILLFALCASAQIGACAGPNDGAFAHTFYLVRHGAFVADPKADPALGPGLTALGIAQARMVGARFHGLPVRFDSMMSSTMTRARETAAVMHEAMPDVPMAQPSALIAECGPPTGPVPGESQSACEARLETAFAQFLVPAHGAVRNDVIVAHSNVIRWFVTKALGVDTRAWTGMNLAHASVTVIRVNPNGTMSVLSVGDVGHLPPNLQSWGTDADPQLTVPK